MAHSGFPELWLAGTALLAVGAAVGAALVALFNHNRRRTHGVRARPEVRARETSEQFRIALEVHDDGLIIVDQHGQALIRNAAAQRYLDLDAGGEAIATTLASRLDAALAGTAGEDELAMEGSQTRVVLIRAVPLCSESSAVGALAWIRDISETRRTDQVRRDFVANVSHELKTPIGALTVLAETMAIADDAVVQQELAERVVREADRLAHIVEDLLDLSLLESEDDLPREPLAVAGIVAEAIDQIRPNADAAGIPVITTGLAFGACVVGDRRQLTSAVTNLLDNAVKYSDSGDIVEVEVREQGTVVVVAVRDHGVGIPAADLERVFERFYRVDRARSRETGGTGLGLSIVRHIVQTHGGEVGVSSTEGAGSQFTIQLPRLNHPPASTLPSPEELDV